MPPCELCGSIEHEQVIESRPDGDWLYCSRYDSWLNLSEHSAELERLEALDEERHYEKDLASRD